jgi:predicted nucleotidyltransferase
MKKRTDRQPVARSALVVLRDGSCLWFPRATVKRSRTEIRMRTAGGVDVVVPAAGADCLTYGASESRPEPIAQLVNAIDVLRGALGARSPKPHVDPRRLERICKKHHIKRLSLFGSVVRDDFGPASDVDILYERESGHRETLGSFTAASDAFADLFGRRGDFIKRSLIENSKNPHRRQSILEDERVVYENGRARLAGVLT